MLVWEIKLPSENLHTEQGEDDDEEEEEQQERGNGSHRVQERRNEIVK